MKRYLKQIIVQLFLVVLIFSQISCGSMGARAKQEDRLSPYRSTGEIRIDDIRRELSKNPVGALDLIGAYREMYRVVNEDGKGEDLLVLEKEASENLRSFLEKAISEERWDDAVSYNRSLMCVDPESEASVSEQYLILEGAKKKLNDGNNLGAFLAAVQAHELSPLSFEDAMLFVERAMAEKQRRTVAYFLAAAEKANSNGIILGEIREYAKGADTVTDMLKGVATVIVDRGIRIERGVGFPDRIGGSAFFVDSSGLMITNYHVIESEVDPKYKGYSRMYIRMGDSTSPRIPARVVGWDKTLDLALIKTEYKCEFVFSVVDRVMPQVGDMVLAIGSPAGLEKTVTSGIVSALSRRFLQVGDVIQIDAAVNHGNSGGPVLDTQGRLIGIVFAGIEYYQGLNFAIPAQRLSAALPAMIQGGKAERPWLGMVINETTSGAEIIYTVPNAPASRHRVPEGSVIKTLNGNDIRTSQSLLIPALQDTIFQSRPGEIVALETLEPNGELKRRLVMTVPRPELPLRDAATIDSRERLAAPLFGLVLSPGQGKSPASSYLVKKVVRGSIADELSISEQDPVSIRGFRIFEKEGYALMEIIVKKRSMGFLETPIRLPARLDSPDTL